MTPDFSLWVFLEQRVYCDNPRSLEDLEHNTEQAVAGTDKKTHREVAKSCEKGEFLSSKRWRTFSSSAVLTHYCYILSILTKKIQINDLQYWVAIGYDLHNFHEVGLKLSRCLTVQLN
jgi:hypothetical protein